MAKERLDVLLVQRGLSTSREKARAVITAGDVFVNGQREDKPGTSFDESKRLIETNVGSILFCSDSESLRTIFPFFS